MSQVRSKVTILTTYNVWLYRAKHGKSDEIQVDSRHEPCLEHLSPEIKCLARLVGERSFKVTRWRKFKRQISSLGGCNISFYIQCSGNNAVLLP